MRSQYGDNWADTLQTQAAPTSATQPQTYEEADPWESRFASLEKGISTLGNAVLQEQQRARQREQATEQAQRTERQNQELNTLSSKYQNLNDPFIRRLAIEEFQKAPERGLEYHAQLAHQYLENVYQRRLEESRNRQNTPTPSLNATTPVVNANRPEGETAKQQMEWVKQQVANDPEVLAALNAEQVQDW